MTHGPSKPDPAPPGRDDPCDPEGLDLIDALFDRELSEEERRRLVSDVLLDKDAAEDLATTARAIGLLRRPSAMNGAPDQTQAILARVGSERGFLGPRWRGIVKLGRAGLAASVLALLLGVAVVDRMNPGALLLWREPAPLASVLRSGADGAAHEAREIASMVEVVRDRASPIARRVTAVLAVAPDQSGPDGQPIYSEDSPMAGGLAAAGLKPGAMFVVGSLRTGTAVRVHAGAGEPDGAEMIRAITVRRAGVASAGGEAPVGVGFSPGTSASIIGVTSGFGLEWAADPDSVCAGWPASGWACSDLVLGSLRPMAVTVSPIDLPASDER